MDPLTHTHTHRSHQTHSFLGGRRTHRRVHSPYLERSFFPSLPLSHACAHTQTPHTHTRTRMHKQTHSCNVYVLFISKVQYQQGPAQSNAELPHALSSLRPHGLHETVTFTALENKQRSRNVKRGLKSSAAYFACPIKSFHDCCSD